METCSPQPAVFYVVGLVHTLQAGLNGFSFIDLQPARTQSGHRWISYLAAIAITESGVRVPRVSQ